MNQQTFELNAGDKILLAIYELDRKNNKGKKITKEEMAIKVWKMFPTDFCIKGYPQYPNADISKYVTKLFKNNLLKGSFYNYIITPKGKEYAKALFLNKKPSKNEMTTSSREIEVEIRRIKGSNVYKIFKNGETNFLESDLYNFLGASSRSIAESNRTGFTSRYNLIVKEVLPFCEKNKEIDPELEKIFELSKILIEKFNHLISKKKAKYD